MKKCSLVNECFKRVSMVILQYFKDLILTHISNMNSGSWISKTSLVNDWHRLNLKIVICFYGNKVENGKTVFFEIFFEKGYFFNACI
jgi:hypothetical protein